MAVAQGMARVYCNPWGSNHDRTDHSPFRRRGPASAGAAADEFIRRGAEAVAARGRFTVALSGGSTPKRLFELLAEARRTAARSIWPRVEFFLGRRTLRAAGRPESNYRMASEAMLSKLSVAAGQFIAWRPNAPDRDQPPPAITRP